MKSGTRRANGRCPRLNERAGHSREDALAHLIQVGAGSGGMPVLDMVCRDRRVSSVTLVEPDVYKPHNAERHLFPPSDAGMLKAELARNWLQERCPNVRVEILICDLLDPQKQQEIEGPLRKRVEKCVAMVEKALEMSN